MQKKKHNLFLAVDTHSLRIAGNEHSRISVHYTHNTDIIARSTVNKP